MASTGASESSKRKSVDDAFERLFGYGWGTTFHLNESEMDSTKRELVKIFGVTTTARILNSRGSNKRQKISQHTRILNYKDIQLPQEQQATVMETTVFAGQTVQTARKQGSTKAKAPAAGNSKIDNVLAQLAGPKSISTVKKTDDDWEKFKESDKQLQDELEKKAQGKDAFLVKQDFMNRVDHRKFELEKEERDRERAKRATT